MWWTMLLPAEAAPRVPQRRHPEQMAGRSSPCAVLVRLAGKGRAGVAGRGLRRVSGLEAVATREGGRESRRTGSAAVRELRGLHSAPEDGRALWRRHEVLVAAPLCIYERRDTAVVEEGSWGIRGAGYAVEELWSMVSSQRERWHGIFAAAAVLGLSGGAV